MGTRVNANPTKEFFISMLTRDIDIRAAILELIDNSIDGAKRMRPDGNYEGLYININFDENKFCIKDNCGGISIKTATEYAFMFGRSKEREKETDQYYTGIFGIGMKRSLFRLGDYFSVESMTKDERFLLNVDVDEWVNSDDQNDWGFVLSEEETGLNNMSSIIGTTITVSKLHPGISKQLSLASFNASLISYIERYRTIAVENGLEIKINDKRIVFVSEQLVDSETVKPYSYCETIDDVKVRIIAGIAPKGKPENAGWYVYCNGRLVIFADKTNQTVWGEDGVRSYHPSLAIFRGFVFFESTNLERLPWNTTKTNVDASSQYYIFAKTKMRDATLQIIKSCNEIIEGVVSNDIEKTIFDARNLKRIDTVTIDRLTAKPSVFTFDIPEIKCSEPYSNITFSKPKREIEIMKKQMKVKTNKAVGERSFDYYFRKECENDE